MQRSSFALNFTSALFVCFALLGSTSMAEEQKLDCRVLGLFQQDRETDLRMVVENLPGLKLVEVNFKTGLATFQFDPATLFPGKKKVADQLQALDQLLRQNSRGTFQAKPLNDLPREKLTTIEIDIVGLDCKGCSFAAYLAVYELEGVENATASFHDGKVTAWIDARVTSQEKLEAALTAKQIKLRSATPSE